MDAAEIPDGWHKVPASLHRQQRQQQHPDHNDQQMQPCNTPSITVPRAPLSHLKLISSKPPASFWCVTHIHCRNAAEFICLKCHVIRVFPGRVERQPLWKHLFSKKHGESNSTKTQHRAFLYLSSLRKITLLLKVVRSVWSGFK